MSDREDENRRDFNAPVTSSFWDRETSHSESDSESSSYTDQYPIPESDIPTLESDSGLTSSLSEGDDLTDNDASFELDPNDDLVPRSDDAHAHPRINTPLHHPQTGQRLSQSPSIDDPDLVLANRSKRKRKDFEILEDTTATENFYINPQGASIEYEVACGRDYVNFFIRNICFDYILQVVEWVREIARDVDIALSTNWLRKLTEYLRARLPWSVPEELEAGDNDWWIEYWLGELEYIIEGVRKDWLRAYEDKGGPLRPRLPLNEPLYLLLGFAICQGGKMDIQRKDGRDFYSKLLQQLCRLARYHLPDPNILWLQRMRTVLQPWFPYQMIVEIWRSGEVEEGVIRRWWVRVLGKNKREFGELSAEQVNRMRLNRLIRSQDID